MKYVIVILMLALSPGAANAESAWGAAILGGLQGFGEAMQEAARQEAYRDSQLRLLEEQHRLEMQRIEREYQLRREEQARQVELQEREREARERQRQAQESERRIAADRKARQEEEDQKTAINTGTGFFVSPDGYVITNAHVVRDKTTYAIRDLAGKFYKAQLVSRDSVKDLALLKIDGRFPALKVGDSTKVTKGQHVLAVGFPQISIQGNESKVTDGIISSFSGLRDHDHWFQISVPIQGGNSGGPLVTENGIVVGVVVASVNVGKFYDTTGNLPQNVNFAIKSSVLLDFLADQRIKNVATSKGKTSIDAVDRATILVVATNGPIDVSYTVSPEQSAREERERVKQTAEAASRRKADEAAEKKRQAIVATKEYTRVPVDHDPFSKSPEPEKLDLSPEANRARIENSGAPSSDDNRLVTCKLRNGSPMILAGECRQRGGTVEIFGQAAASPQQQPTYAPPSPQSAQAVTDDIKASGQQLRSCLQAIYDSPTSEPLRRHVPMDLKSATLEQMTDSSFPTDIEITAYLAIHPQRQACNKSFLDRIERMAPSVVPILASMMTKIENSVIELIQRKKTWGDYVRQAKDGLPKAQAELVSEVQRLQAGPYLNHPTIEQRQTAANAITQYLSNWPKRN